MGGEEGRSPAGAPSEPFTTPRLVKISIADPAQADSLLQLGFEVIVEEPDYVIARVDSSEVQTLRALRLSWGAFESSDLVQLLVRIPVRDSSDVAELVNLGIDLWEVREDSVVAQVYDKHIREAQARGFVVVCRAWKP